MQTERFLAVHKQTKERRVDIWKEISKLDKRIWNVSLITDDEPEEPEPLAYILIGSLNTDGAFCWEPIYKISDLEGVHIGGIS